MRLSRLAPALAAGILVVATTTPAIAQGADPVEGVGTTTGELTVLGLDAGQVLALDLLTDAGVANIDETAGARSAAAQIAAFSLTSELLDIAQSVPLLAVESTGAEQRTGQEVAIPANPIASGAALPLSLSALVDEAGARSTLGAALADLDVLGGIASVTGVDLDLGSSALTSDAAATRGLAVQDLSLLDLEALLEGLGISLTDLPLDTLLGLLEGLGLLESLPLDALGIDVTDLSADSLLAAVDGLVGELDDLEAGLTELERLETNLTDDLTGTVCDVGGDVGGVIDDLLGGGTGGDTVICDATDTVTEQLEVVRTAIDDLTAQLDDVLAQLRGLLTGTGGVLDLLGGTALLNVDGLDVQVLTKATDDVATSVADVTASLGAVTVGELPVLGSVDLAAPTAEVDALLGQVEGAIGGVLGEIAPSLADLVSVSTLQEQTSVVEEAGTVVSSADFTGLVVEVQPILSELQALLDGLAGVESVADTLQGLGLAVPTTGATEVAAVNDLLAPVTDGLPLLAALDTPLSLQVAALGQQSVFAASAAAAPAAPATPGQTPTPTLPRTGSSDTLVLGLAMAAAVAALAGRQLLRRNAG
ncbi:MAG: hypothetical protein ACLGIC_09585 [Acidimicrobiia bacterium]